MTESQVYTPHIRAVYNKLGSKLPLPIWVKSIGSKLPYFQNDSDIYNPITLQIKIAGGINTSDGAVAVQVAPTDSQWYSKLQNAVQEMTSKKTNVDIVDYLGDCIKSFNYSQLYSAGELDVVNARNQSIVRIKSAVAPPEHMATNKIETIHGLVKDIRDTITDTIASSLKGHTMAEIGQMTLQDGPVQKSIEQALNERKDWAKFMNTYAMDDVARNNTVQQKTSAMAKSILFQVREGLKANEPQIRTFYALKEGSKKGQSPLWSQHPATIASEATYKDEYSMFRDIAEDAMYNPLLSRKLVYIIHRGSDRQVKSSIRNRRKVPKKSSNVDEQHIMDKFYHQYYYKKHGKFPGHVIDKFNKKATISTEYPGNEREAVNMFLMFSGKHVPLQEKRIHTLVPLGDSVKHTLVPISVGSEMPELVPIPGLKKKHTLVPLGDSVKHNLVPISVESEMPELVPIPGLKKKHTLVPLGDSVECKKHTLVPISEMPELVPIPGKKHRLVPIERGMDSIASAIDAEDFSEPVFEMPNLSAFLRKK